MQFMTNVRLQVYKWNGTRQTLEKFTKLFLLLHIEIRQENDYTVRSDIRQEINSFSEYWVEFFCQIRFLYATLIFFT